MRGCATLMEATEVTSEARGPEGEWLCDFDDYSCLSMCTWSGWHTVDAPSIFVLYYSLRLKRTSVLSGQFVWSRQGPLKDRDGRYGVI